MPRFGLVLPIQSQHTALDDLLAELQDEVLAAERAGFDGVFLPEFHQARGGAIVSPLLVCAWLAARTVRIRVGTLVLAGPLHDPVRLAEDVMMLDWATRGRVVLGIGSAHMPPDFALFGRPREHRQAVLDEVLDVLELAWTGEPFEYDGRFTHGAGQVTPGTFTKPRPPVWIGAHGPRGLRRAAERADAWVCDPQRDIDVVATLADKYRAAAGAAGRPASVVLFREAWISASRDEAEQLWAPHAMKVHRLYRNVGVYLPEFEPWIADVRSSEEFTLDRVAPGRFLYGSPDDVRETARDWFARTGADYMAVRMRHPTGPGHEATLEAIERFGREVIGPLAAEGRSSAATPRSR